MKRLILVLMLVSIVGLSLLDAQIWNLEVTSVSQQEITANLYVTNNTGSDINWTFGDPIWATLLLDGQSTPFSTLPVVFRVNIPVGETRVEQINYTLLYLYPQQFIPLGTHIVQGARQSLAVNEPNWVPVGPASTITVNDTYHFIDFHILPESATQDSLSFILSMTNNDVYPFSFYTGGMWARMSVNGALVDMIPQQNEGEITIQPNCIHLRRLVYRPTIPIPNGTHEVRFFFSDFLSPSDYYYPEILSVTVGPTGIVDEHLQLTQMCVYPNPFKGNVSLAYQSKASSKTELKIYNIKGQLVNSIAQFTKNGENIFSWDGKDIQGKSTPSGMYFIRIKDGAEVQTIKCMKMNN